MLECGYTTGGKTKMEDKVEGMSYKHIDPKTGETKVYEVSYSQVLQKRIDEHLEKVNKELKQSNRLKIYLLIGFILLVAMGLLIWFNTGTIGQLVRIAICES